MRKGTKNGIFMERLICFAGDKFVDAAVAIATRLKIPQIVVGATIVSLGTTLPEILVSTTAVLGAAQSPDICFGNAIGSIICNTALIAGIGQLIRPTREAKTSSINWRLSFFVLTVLAMFAMLFFNSLTLPRCCSSTVSRCRVGSDSFCSADSLRTQSFRSSSRIATMRNRLRALTRS